MSLFSIFRRQSNDVERKDSRAAINGMPSLISPNWSVKSYASRLQSGYRQNPVGYRCVRMIAEACASLPLVLSELGQRQAQHPILDLIVSPNQYETGVEFLERCYSFLLLHGNSYIEQVASSDATVSSDLDVKNMDARDFPSELHVLRPDRVRIIAGAQGWPIAYEYRVNDHVTRFEHGQASSPLLHLKSFHPTDDHYGLSPMEAASQAVEIHNSANGWNKSLFDNAARPSGALVYRGSEGATHLTDEQFTRLKNELEENFQGYQNAGRPLLLEGGLDWSSISLSPQDMDFIQVKHSAARDIALSFGVPPMLLGIPGDNTYSNYAEANRAFWRQTVLPLARRTTRSLGQFLSPTSLGVQLDCDLDSVPALMEERRALWERVANADFISDDEKRLAVGLGARNRHDSELDR